MTQRTSSLFAAPHRPAPGLYARDVEIRETLGHDETRCS